MGISQSKKFLKSTVDGYVHVYTDILAERDDMVECDKDGKILSKADERRDQSDLSLLKKINAQFC